MTDLTTPAPPRPAPSAAPTRAERLRHEAGNCLTIAVRERDPAFTAQLIDEAVRLTARARELAARRPA